MSYTKHPLAYSRAWAYMHELKRRRECPAVTITQDHLDRGVPDDACNCALALALKDAFECECAVQYSGIRLWGGGRYGIVPMTIEVEEFIGLFDTGFKLKPRTFYLPIPEEFRGKASVGGNMNIPWEVSHV